METVLLAIQAAGNVLLASLIFGAGLPLAYALAMRALYLGDEGAAAGDSAPDSSLLGKVLALALLAVVVLGIVTGLVLIVSSGLGYEVSFEHVIPTLTKE